MPLRVNGMRKVVAQMPKWIYDGDCLITSCCNVAYDISRFNHNDEEIFVPVKCPNCGAEMERNDINE